MSTPRSVLWSSASVARSRPTPERRCWKRSASAMEPGAARRWPGLRSWSCPTSNVRPVRASTRPSSRFWRRTSRTSAGSVSICRSSSIIPGRFGERWRRGLFSVLRPASTGASSTLSFKTRRRSGRQTSTRCSATTAPITRSTGSRSRSSTTQTATERHFWNRSAAPSTAESSPPRLSSSTASRSATPKVANTR